MQARENWQMKVSKNLQKLAYLLNQTMSSGVLSVKCYIQNSFGRHVSCVDLVKSDGKDDFLNFFMTQIQYFYHFSWFIV